MRACLKDTCVLCCQCVVSVLFLVALLLVLMLLRRVWCAVCACVHVLACYLAQTGKH